MKTGYSRRPEYSLISPLFFSQSSKAEPKSGGNAAAARFGGRISWLSFRLSQLKTMPSTTREPMNGNLQRAPKIASSEPIDTIVVAQNIRMAGEPKFQAKAGVELKRMISAM